MKKANCVFVVVLDGDLVQSPEHLGVSYLIAILREAGHKCTLVDVYPEQDDDEVARIQVINPDFIGISLTTVNFERTVQIGKQLREKIGTSCHICAGGPVATFMGKKLLENRSWQFLDSLVRGEGDNVILPLVEKIIFNEPLGQVPGLTLRSEEEAKGAVVAVKELDNLPWAARDQLEVKISKGKKIPYVRVSTSRGCTSFCTFCNAPHARNNLSGTKVWRGRSPENVLKEVEFISRKYNIDTFDFVDSTYEDPGDYGKARIKKIASLLLSRKLNIFYNICAQAKNWTEKDDELINLLFNSGLEKVLIGIESGSEKALNLFQKRSSVQDNERAIKLFRDKGVYVAFGFIMFNPYSDWSEIEQSAEFLFRNLGYNLRRFSTRLELYPGTEILTKMQNDGLLLPEYWETLNPFAYTYVDSRVEEFGRNLNNLYGELYAKKGKIHKEPGVFEFETKDITIHTYFSRLLRKYVENEEVSEILKEHISLIDEVKASLRNFNANLFYDIMDKSKAGKMLPIHYPEIVAQTYGKAIHSLSSIQLKVGMILKRQFETIL